MDLTATPIKDLADHAGERVVLLGWVAQFRSSGKLAFVTLRDGTGRVQVVVSRADVDDGSWNTVTELSYEASVRVEGIVREDERAPSGSEVESWPL